MIQVLFLVNYTGLIVILISLYPIIEMPPIKLNGYLSRRENER